MVLVGLAAKVSSTRLVQDGTNRVTFAPRIAASTVLSTQVPPVRIGYAEQVYFRLHKELKFGRIYCKQGHVTSCVVVWLMSIRPGFGGLS
jgi:hypothetical protein